MLQFDLPKNQSSIIKVVGIGGGGSNAVNHMYNQGINGVDFIVCNTDAQALHSSPVPLKIQLGSSLTDGRGAGSIPSVGKDATIENIEDIRNILEVNTKMLFITAGMGGGTGTGGAPVIAALAREMGILTVGIVTVPFAFEGRKRRMQAEEGIRELRENVDALLVICNDKLRELYGNLKLSEAFNKADNILTTAAKGIAEIITVTGYINVDFEDVKTVMRNSGVCLMGSGVAEGQNRSIEAVEMALSSPLLNDNEIKGASDILLYIASGEEEISMDEVYEITEYIQREAGQDAEIIWGNGKDDSLGNKISVTLIATGFNPKNQINAQSFENREKKVLSLDDEVDLRHTFAPQPVNEKIEEEKQEQEQEEEKEPKIVNERTIEFEIAPFTFSHEQNNEESLEPTLIRRTENKVDEYNDDPLNSVLNGPEKAAEEIDEMDNVRRSQERIQKLRDLSLKLKTPEGLAELENEPAYVRRNVSLADVKPSSESQISRYTLSEGEDNRVEIKSNNSFLHDNVD